MAKIFKVKYVDNFDQEQEIELKHFFRCFTHADLDVDIPPVEEWLTELALEKEDLDYLLAQPYDIYYKVFYRFLDFCSKDLETIELSLSENNKKIQIGVVSMEGNNISIKNNKDLIKTKRKKKMKHKISLIIFLALIAAPGIVGVIIENRWLTLPAVILSTTLLTVSIFYKGEK